MQEDTNNSRDMVIKLTSKEMAVQMSEITEDQIQRLVKRTIEVTVTTIDLSKFNIFSFQGFDPEAIMKKLMILKNYHKLTDEQLQEDIMYMIAANIYMGNLSGKALGRRSQEGRDMVDELAVKYQIRAGSTSTGLPSDILTFPRVAGSFPVLSCTMALKLPTKDMVGQPFKSETVPPVMRMNAFASLCSSAMPEKTRLFLLKAVASYSCDQSIVFEKGRRAKSKMKGKELEVEPTGIAANQWTFIWNAAEARIPSEDIRRNAILHFNISSYYSKIVKVVENYNKIMSDEGGVPSQSEFEADISTFISSS